MGETGKTLPDITTILSLAGFFDISLDELFDRTSYDKERDIEEYCRQDLEFANKGEVSKRLSLWRKATQKYPGDFHCLERLAHVLHSTAYSDGHTSEEAENNLKECIAICERILRDCTDNDQRESVIQMLVYIYSDTRFSFANEQKAVEYANMAGSMHVSREELLEFAYFTEDSKERQRRIKHANILEHMDSLTSNICYGQYESDEERIGAYNVALMLWKTLIYDGNYVFYHSRIQRIYMKLAFYYGKLKKRDETIEALKNAFYHAKCFDHLPYGELHYTSVYVNAAISDASKCTKNYTCTDTDNVKQFLRNEVFDFLRNDPEFIQLKMQ